MCLSAIYNDMRSASAYSSQTGEEREPRELLILHCFRKLLKRNRKKMQISLTNCLIFIVCW